MIISALNQMLYNKKDKDSLTTSKQIATIAMNESIENDQLVRVKKSQCRGACN